MAADLSLRVFELPNPQQTAVMDSLAKSGVQRTWITETLTMASGGPANAPMLVSIKAVDPSVYPFYGEIRIAPPAPLRTALTSDTVAVSDDVLLRLHLKIGDTIQLGGQSFRIIGQVTYEPDRMLGSLNVGPRVMMTRAGLDRTGLMLPGSRAAERFLFRLPPGSPSIAQVRERLKKAFPEALIADFRETHPIITQGLSRATTFLSLVSLITLIVGAIGVATAMQAHIQQRMDSIAIMKCLGARSIAPDAHLSHPDRRARPRRRPARRSIRNRHPKNLPRISGALFPVGTFRALGSDHRRARHRHRCHGHAALHSAAAYSASGASAPT